MIPMLRTDPFYNFYNDLFDLEKFTLGDSDTIETEDSFIISVDLPGVEKDQIKLKWERNGLTIEAKRNREKIDSKVTTINRKYGKFLKTYHFQSNVTKEADASFHNGVLTITVKKENAKETLIPIK